MSIDYLALFAPVSRDEIVKFRQDSRNSAQPWATSNSAVTAVTVTLAVLGAIIAVGIIAAVVPLSFSIVFRGEFTGIVMLLALLALVIVAALKVSQRVAAWRKRWESLLRRTRFAAANSLRYVPMVKNPGYPGMIFSLGERRHSVDNYQSTGTPQFDVGNYYYTTGSDKNEVTHDWGYLALRLDRTLPHMVLDARSTRVLGRSTLPVSFRRDQRLSLEGDFDSHFTLYCPRQYERDALYVFTPDLMALLIDESSAFDVEIVDDWMFVYSSTPFELDKPATVSRLLRIIDTVGTKTLRQTHRYVDERVSTDPAIDLVAPHGQRLKVGRTAAGIGGLLLAAYAVFIFLQLWR